MQNLLPVMKTYLPWLKNADSQALKHACRQLDTAYQKYFHGETNHPKFKTRKGRQSYTTAKGESIHINKNQKKVKLPIIGWLKTRGLHIPENIKINRATVSKDPDGKYYVSISYEQEVNIPLSFSNPLYEPISIGLDFREGDLYCDSNGISAGKPNNIGRSLNKLKKAQDKLSRMIESHITGYRTDGNKRYPVYDKKLSRCKNIEKQRKHIARLHKHIANQRKDFLQKQSTAITKQYDVICIESFKVKEMLLTKEDDKSAIKRHNINKKVYDDGWFMFTEMLGYKAEWMNKNVIKVGEDFPSTQTCHCCGNINSEVNDVTIRKWKCQKCGKEHDRDVNAAINIKNEGLRILRAM